MLISRHTSKTIALQGSAQALTMGLAFVTGLIIVRALPKDEYAYYSVCVSLIAALALIGEAGVGSVVLSRGGQLATRSLRFAYLISAARKFRSRISMPVLLIGGSILYTMLVMTGASPLYAACLLAFSLLSIGATLSTTVYQNVHRLNLNFAFMRRMALASSSMRLALLFLLMYVLSIDAITALLVGFAVHLFTYFLQKRHAQQIILMPLTKTKRYMRDFNRSAQRVLPTTLLIVASEQSVIFILAASGATSSIAEISALSRFGVVFTLFNMLYADLASPYIARLNMPATQVAKRIGLFAGLYFLTAVAVWLLLCSLAPYLLSLLGEQYDHLTRPFYVILLGQGILNLGYSIGYLAQARGWIQWSWTYAIFMVIWLICATMFLDLSSIHGAALLMATQSLPNLLTQAVRILAGVRRGKKSALRT